MGSGMGGLCPFGAPFDPFMSMFLIVVGSGFDAKPAASKILSVKGLIVVWHAGLAMVTTRCGMVWY
jgi:hypothetical protein